MIRTKRCFGSLQMLAICALAHPFMSLACQTTQTVPSEDALSHSMRLTLKPFTQVKMFSFTGTAVYGSESGHFTVQINGDKATLTLPDGFPLQQEIASNQHSSLGCELYRASRLISKNTSGLCGFPAPWFYPFALVAQLNPHAYQSVSKQSGDQISVNVVPAGIAPFTSGNPTGALIYSQSAGTIVQMNYSFQVLGLNRTQEATVVYSNVQSFHGLPLPQTISLSVGDMPKLILTVESVEMGGR